MACRGWYTALLPDEQTAVTTAPDLDELLQKLNEIYPTADVDGRIQSVDKSWDAMHRVLCGGWLDTTHGDKVLRACVLGGRQLSSRNDWVISFVEAPLVAQIAEATADLNEPYFREQYFALHRDPPGLRVRRYEIELTQEDYEYTWAYFTEVRDFYRRAAKRGISTIFAVDQ